MSNLPWCAGQARDALPAGVSGFGLSGSWGLRSICSQKGISVGAFVLLTDRTTRFYGRGGQAHLLRRVHSGLDAPAQAKGPRKRRRQGGRAAALPRLHAPDGGGGRSVRLEGGGCWKG